MAYDGAIIVGSISIITLMIAKFKCYIKKWYDKLGYWMPR